MQPYITTVRRDEESARATAREQAAAVDERLEQLDTELELAEQRVAAEFAATEDQVTHAVDAGLHRWDAYLDRMQVKAAARTGIERERAETAIADLRQRRVAISKSFPHVGTGAGGGWRDTKTRVLAELDAAEDQGRRGRTLPEVVGEPAALPSAVASEGRLTSVLHVRRAGMKELP
ncbi:MAG TPA: hypothetical protein VFZ70_14825 [Euzebyales bacterium]